MSHILIVEDDKNIAHTLKLFCEHLNKPCVHVKTVGEALECVKKNKPDLILLDLLLENENSAPLIEKVRDICGVKAPRIVVMSAMIGANEIATKHDLDFISKPFNLDMLERLIA